MSTPAEYEEFQESIARYQALAEKPVVQYQTFRHQRAAEIIEEIYNGIEEYQDAELRIYNGLDASGKVVAWIVVLSPAKGQDPEEIHYLGDASFPCPPWCG